MYRVQTPVLFVIFNRPEITGATFGEIAKARPKKLFIVADGPRPDRPGEAERCEAARQVVKKIDWDCELVTDFSPVNLGSRDRVTSGITLAFKTTEELIILEDDCSPDPTFFQFCDEMLARYRPDKTVMSVGGTCFLGADDVPPESYFFSSIPLIWGWATWRRAWNEYDVSMSHWKELRTSAYFKGIVPSFVGRLHYRMHMDRVARGSPDIWDFQWLYSIWNASGLAITPTRNLVRNVGFGEHATHTHFRDKGLAPSISPMTFPLHHPDGPPRARVELDDAWIKRQFHPFAKIKRKILRFLQ
jgi:hypothetical protein